MTQLRDIAVAAQEYELACFIRDVEDSLESKPPEDVAVLREVWRRLTLAESQLATMRTAGAPKDGIEAEAKFVLECDVDDIDVYHFDDEETTGESAAKRDTGPRYLSACRTVAARAIEMQQQLRRLEAANAEMLRRNQLLRDRPGLPMERTVAANEYEEKIRQLKTQGRTCCFCSTPFASLQELKQHSQSCRFHPLVQQVTKQQDAMGQQIAQTLGGFPWYKDDPANFPDATEKDGVVYAPYTLEALVDILCDRVAGCAANRGTEEAPSLIE